MADKRFRTTEQAILIAYYKLCDYPATKKIAKSANISCATFYRHHKAVISIPDDYEEYLLQIYTKKIKKFLSKKGVTLKNTFLRTLAFIASNDEVFTMLFEKGRKSIIEKMLDRIKVVIFKEWRLGGNPEKMFNIYKKEILGVIEFWHRQNFANQGINKALDDILYLTKTARQKLLPLE